ncbi:LOW QUALITY PROTEIN: cyclin-D5-3-like [Lycium ferocissimum]|uniref:LOW QUALITY PROTEIN: cyclin-D5-3-like n=1 Tax=Lycium ferocissimum TaxID=112874 RepID=UPI002814B4BA|nr:LOW QUALITY PROTEIN: cyclin-D5-3-like [Lycium ferocissimum]
MENSETLTEEKQVTEQENERSEDDDDDGYGDDNNEMNYVQLLIGNEIASGGLNDQEASEIINDNWIQEARYHAIHYINRVSNSRHGFRFGMQTMYTSVIYLDRFLATRTINIGEYWAVRLLSMACLSLAAKMDETRGNVPALSQYPLNNYDINPIDITQMELLVLDVLNWDMSFVTPFSFTKYFVSRFCRQNSRKHSTRMKTVEIIMSVLRDVRLMNHRPSVIAAAATLLALNKNLTREEMEIEIYALRLNGFLQIDNVCYCYYKLLELN